MTTEAPKTQKSDESLFSFITSIIKRSSDVPDSFNTLLKGVNTLTEEVKLLAFSVTQLAKTVYEHHATISEMLVVQEFILKNMKKHNDSGHNEVSKPKNKSHKPN